MPGHTNFADLPADAVVSGLSWAAGHPTLRVRSADQPSSHERDLIGTRFAYRADPQSRRWCLGHRPLGGPPSLELDCTNAPEPGTRHCARCAAKEAAFAASLHHAHTRDRGGMDQAMRAHLQQSNLLYLAGFRDGSIKVGTSTQPRLPIRLAEQGAWLARIVARADDGYAVRDVEDRVTLEAGLPQSVSARRKLEGFEHPIDDESLGLELDRWEAAVGAILERMGDPRLHAEDESWRAPAYEHPQWKHVHRYPLALDAGTHDFVVVDACGRFALLERAAADDLFVADLQSLYGVQLDVGDYGSDEVAVQDSLF